MERTLRMSLLFDFYGPLLTDRQQEVYQLYFHDDLSLGEIGEQLGVSRQAVYDILRRSAAIVEDYEEKLALVAKHIRRVERCEELLVIFDELDRLCAAREGSDTERELLSQARQRLQEIITDS